MCGITTGGREECYWNCEVGSTGLQEGLFKGFLLTPPDCLLDCFPKVWTFWLSTLHLPNFCTEIESFFHIPYVFFSSFVQNYCQDSCFYHLLKDYKKNGICEGFFNPLSYNTTSCKTKLNEENILEITDGVCSRKTEKLLMQPRKCAKIHQNEPELIWRNLLFLLYYMCNTDITKKYFKIFQNPDTTLPTNPSQTARFGIFHTVREDPNWGPISLNLNFGKVSFVIYI